KKTKYVQTPTPSAALYQGHVVAGDTFSDKFGSHHDAEICVEGPDSERVVGGLIE
ncbi:hypothetical protein AAVH_13019, partial [Aphelenchoides avenae]